MKFHCMLKKLQLREEEYVLMQAISLFSPGDSFPQLLGARCDLQGAAAPGKASAVSLAFHYTGRSQTVLFLW